MEERPTVNPHGHDRQRLVNDLKAVLNAGYAVHRGCIPHTLPEIIKCGVHMGRQEGEPSSVARDNQILTDSQITCLLRAAREIDTEQRWDGDLFRLVLALAATGARFSQVMRMRVAERGGEARNTSGVNSQSFSVIYVHIADLQSRRAAPAADGDVSKTLRGPLLQSVPRSAAMWALFSPSGAPIRRKNLY